MARKPKLAPGNEPMTPVAEDVPASQNAPSPARRGRKPKTVVASAEASGGTAGIGSLDIKAGFGRQGDAPVRRRPGPKPKQPASAGTAALLRDDVRGKRGREGRHIEAASEPSLLTTDIPATEVTDQEPTRQAGRRAGTKKAGLGPSTSRRAQATASTDPARAAKPAAHWDRTTDIVQFDWAAIEQTAAQEGPNQVMAKLLIAARVEGANSRWPL